MIHSILMDCPNGHGVVMIFHQSKFDRPTVISSVAATVASGQVSDTCALCGQTASAIHSGLSAETWAELFPDPSALTAAILHKMQAATDCVILTRTPSQGIRAAYIALIPLGTLDPLTTNRN